MPRVIFLSFRAQPTRLGMSCWKRKQPVYLVWCRIKVVRLSSSQMVWKGSSPDPWMWTISPKGFGAWPPTQTCANRWEIGPANGSRIATGPTLSANFGIIRGHEPPQIVLVLVVVLVLEG